MKYILIPLLVLGACAEVTFTGGPDVSGPPCSPIELQGAGDGMWSVVSAPDRFDLVEPIVAEADNARTRFSAETAGAYVLAFTSASGEVDEVRVQVGFEVNTLNDVVDADDALLSLREAIDAAQACPGTHEVQIIEPGTLALSEPLVVESGSGSIAIVGRGIANTTLTTTGTRLFEINGARFELRDLTVSGVQFDGGGGVARLRGDGTFFLLDAHLRDNRTNGSDAAALIVADEGTVGFVNAVVEDNVGSGSAVARVLGGAFNATDSRFVNNEGAGNGGVAQVVDGSIDIRSSIVEGNIAVNGGAFHLDGGQVDIGDDVEFNANQASERGGAMWVEGTATAPARLSSRGNYVENRAVTHGGAISLGDFVSARLDVGAFESNVVEGSNARGGAIFGGSRVECADVAFVGNRAVSEDGQSAGGAIAMGAADAIFTTSGCVFAGNESDLGGAIHADAIRGANIARTRFVENSAADGGALHVSGFTITIDSDSVIAGNMATGEGGGIWFSGTSGVTDDEEQVLRLYGVDVADNVASEGGGVHSRGDVELIASPVQNNEAATRGGGICNVEGTVYGSGEVSGNRSDEFCDEANTTPMAR